MSILISDDHLLLTKNIWYKVIRLILSLAGESLFFILLFNNLYSVIDNKTNLVLMLLILITILYIGFVANSIRNYVKDRNYLIRIDNESILVNERHILSKGTSKIGLKENVNRWGTLTFDIYLFDNNTKIKLIEGVDRKKKDDSIKRIEGFLMIPLSKL